MPKRIIQGVITKAQKDYYRNHKKELIEKYFDQYWKDKPKIVDPDAIRDLFMEIGYNKRNVQKFQGICKVATRDIFEEALKRNKGKIKKVIFAAGLPATGKSSHLLAMGIGELIYDGTINDEKKFLYFIQTAINMGYSVEVFVYSANPNKAFENNLKRGDMGDRYVPISHYEKVANTINKREKLLKEHFQNQIIFRNFEMSLPSFTSKQKKFKKLIIKRHELERIAKRHVFHNNRALQSILK